MLKAGLPDRYRLPLNWLPTLLAWFPYFPHTGLSHSNFVLCIAPPW